MKNLFVAIWAEYMKARRSKIFLITIIIFLFIPLMLGLMMFLFQNPEISAKLGIIGTKAKMFGDNDWKGYLSLVNQTHATIGLIGFGFVTAWIFGREHSDHTLKDILALPVSRSIIVTAKFIVSFGWCLLLSVILVTVSVGVGKLMVIPNWSSSMFSEFLIKYSISALLTLLLASPVAYIAGLGRGYFAAIGFVIFSMALAQFAGVLGLGPYIPWAIPGLYSVALDVEGMNLVYSSYIILAITFLLGYFLTVSWWNRADHH